MRKKIKLLINLFLFSIIFLSTNSKADLNNKIIISVGKEIISNYDFLRELNYLNVISLGKFKSLNDEESKKIATDSLIKDKIKTNVLSNYPNIFMNNEIVDNQINNTIRTFGFRSLEDFKKYLEYESYDLMNLKKKFYLS